MTVKLTGRRSLFHPGGFLGLPPWLTRAGRRPSASPAQVPIPRTVRASGPPVQAGDPAGHGDRGASPLRVHVLGPPRRRLAGHALALELAPAHGDPPGSRGDRCRLEAAAAPRHRADAGASCGAPTPSMGRRCSGCSDYAGLDPDHALLRWGNFDRTLYLPSTVFEADDTGRSYRFRPGTRVDLGAEPQAQGRNPGVLPGPRDARGFPRSSRAPAPWWSRRRSRPPTPGACAGPSPTPSAPLRGIVLGDSYMQGLFVGDDQTPSECLKRELSGQAQGQDGGPQHRPSRLLARAGVLHAQGIRRQVPSAVRGAQPVRQRLRRSVRSPRRQGRLGRRQVLARADHPVLQGPRSDLPRGPRALGQPARGPPQGGVLPGQGLEHPRNHRNGIPGPDRRLRHRAAPPEAEAASGRGSPARPTPCSTATSATATSPRWAARSGPAPSRPGSFA